MSNITGTIRAKATVEPATDPTIQNVPIPTANIEVPIVIGASTKKMMIRVRGTANLKLSFESGDSGTLYITVPKGCTYSDENIIFTSGFIYVQTDKNSQVVELLEWA